MFSRKTGIYLAISMFAASLIGLGFMSVERLWGFDGSADGWLGYWGGIIGSAIGVIGALIVLQGQIESDREARKDEKIDNTFFNLLNLFNEIQQELISKEADSFEAIHGMIKIKNNKLIKEKQGENFVRMWPALRKKIIENRELFTVARSILDEEHTKINYTLNEEIRGLVLEKERKSKELSNAGKEELEKIITRRGCNNNLLDSIKIIDVLMEDNYLTIEKLEAYKSVIKQLGSLKKKIQIFSIPELANLENFLTSLIAEMQEYSQIEITESEKNRIIDESVSLYYSKTGKYFRMFHRILKYLNENVKDVSQHKNYVGFLRAMVNETEIVVLYYNSFFTNQGDGLGKELQRTEFFGDKSDFESTSGIAGHVSKGQLFWPDDDIKKMKSFHYQ